VYTVAEIFDVENIVTLKSGNGPIDRSHTSSYRRYLVIMALSCTVSEKSEVLVENRDCFHTPPAFDTPVRESPVEYCHNVWYGKTTMVWLPEGEKVRVL